MSRGQLTDKVIQRHSLLQGVNEDINAVFDSSMRKHKVPDRSNEYNKIAQWVKEQKLAERQDGRLMRGEGVQGFFFSSMPSDMSSLRERINALRTEHADNREMNEFE